MAKPNIKNKNNNQKQEKVVVYREGITITELSNLINTSPASLIKTCFNFDVMANVNQVLERDLLELLCESFGYKVVEENLSKISSFEEEKEDEDPKLLVKRPPIVTVMGHVDHGKTTLLDTIRKTRVTAGEAGGITQHIGAYQVIKNDKLITFIDTPGHAAFTEMRARGAKITDIVIIVVAADDGVMPQTLEAIDHAKAAKVPIIVAVNKTDKITSNPEKVMSELSERGVVAEEWGGDVPFVKISALKGEGIDELLDNIDVVSEISELKANPNRKAKGTVIEASLDKGRGPIATVIVEKGTLKQGDHIVVGNIYGKVRTLNADTGKFLKQALPSQPVVISGLSEVPQAGDKFMVFNDEKTAKQVSDTKKQQEKEKSFNKGAKTLESILGDSESKEKTLNIVIKGDTQGSIEVLTNMLNKISVQDFKANVIRSSVGAISENDIILADASDAILIGFNVRPTAAIRNLAEEKNVVIKTYSIIYEIQEEIENALKGMVAPETKEVIIGQAEVREIFRSSKFGNISGCMVTDGVIERDSLIRIMRDGIVIYDGKLISLKRFKDDVKEVKNGFDCGLRVDKFDDVKIGDVIEAYKMKEVE